MQWFRARQARGTNRRVLGDGVGLGVLSIFVYSEPAGAEGLLLDGVASSEPSSPALRRFSLLGAAR
eukprot:15433083-Alexandrium_andersonii.AAC.1